MKLEYILLGLLARGPVSGYDIGKWMQREGRFYRSNTDQSQIYRVLKRMEDAGWIGHVVDPRTGRPDAKVYRMTEAGRAEVVRWSREPYAPPSRFQDADFHVRFDIAGALDPESLRNLLVTELDARRRQVAESRDRDRTRTYPDPIEELDVERANVLADASHRRGMLEIDTWIGWLERTLEEFDASGVTAPSGVDATGSARS
ncbi:PadR family transcriptional regulator [Labedella endophytica]|jgi:PadR family transcriptional regulator AphA|uniref:PadR family transcriptional regulator n=1 Tax=Labedella endophytica TaxID=1523160 RepID=A0A3S0VH50_9MICO|nr:PadR family transcriptional regulator [Labedella endophytica]RUR01802.1 PadR family transcriptional regulator [Labedella endophytica]